MARFSSFYSDIRYLAGVGIWRYLISTGSPPEKQPAQTFPIAKQPSAKKTSTQTGAGTKPQSNVDEPQTPPFDTMDSRKQPDRQEGSDESVSVDIDKKLPVAPGNRVRKPSLKRDVSQASTEKNRHPENTIKESVAMENAGSIKPKSNNAERWRDAKRLENDRMMLQAVAWAPRPEKRMGVIDGQVVREGDDANGYTVVKIRKQNIILQREGQYFRLEFQRK